MTVETAYKLGGWRTARPGGGDPLPRSAPILARFTELLFKRSQLGRSCRTHLRSLRQTSQGGGPCP